MRSIKQADYQKALAVTVQSCVPFGLNWLTAGDVERLVALARVAGCTSLMAEVLFPGWEDAAPGASRDNSLAIVQRIRAAVRLFDRQHPESRPDLDARVEAAQTALSDLQPERL